MGFDFFFQSTIFWEGLFYQNWEPWIFLLRFTVYIIFIGFQHFFIGFPNIFHHIFVKSFQVFFPSHTFFGASRGFSDFQTSPCWTNLQVESLLQKCPFPLLEPGRGREWNPGGFSLHFRRTKKKPWLNGEIQLMHTAFFLDFLLPGKPVAVNFQQLYP